MFVLFLMDVTKTVASRSSPPDFLGYANAGGLGTIDILIGEPGASLLTYQKDLAILMRAREVAEEDVIKAWYAFIQYQKVNTDIWDGKANCRFINNGKVIEDGPTFGQVWEATERFLQGHAVAGDEAPLQFIVSLWRKISTEGSYFELET